MNTGKNWRCLKLHTGEIIKFLRDKRNLTQKELGKILGVNISSIQKYESGAVSNLKMETIRKLSEYFNLSPIVFIFSEDVELDSLVTGRFVRGRYFDHTKTLMSLNDEGVNKVMEYAEDLLASGNYQKKSRSSQLKSRSKNSS